MTEEPHSVRYEAMWSYGIAITQSVKGLTWTQAGEMKSHLPLRILFLLLRYLISPYLLACGAALPPG